MSGFGGQVTGGSDGMGFATAALPAKRGAHMERLGSGPIVNISSTCGVRAAPFMASYCALKTVNLAERTTAAIPMGRGGRPKEPAKAILFMRSSASRITGVALPVNDGKAAQLYVPA
jgi:meso-butanediol dehydrogenase/(S,S)-butanediol dehydrogenase/diacetyl reductase